MAQQQPTVYTIFCLVIGQKQLFSVDIEPNKKVDHLKEAIKKKKENAFSKIDADSLTLFKVNVTDPNVDERVKKAIATDSRIKLRDPSQKLRKIWDDGFTEDDTIHILVEVPEIGIASMDMERRVSSSYGVVRTRSEEEEERDKLEPLPKKPKHIVDIGGQLVKRWSQPQNIASLETLYTYLQQPLAEEERIPISEDDFKELCVPYSPEYPEHALDEKELKTLFRISVDERARGVQKRFETAIGFGSSTQITEDSFHVVWDINISNILHFILSEAIPIRNSNRNTSTALKRPDYGLLVNNNCVFRGEEKGLDSAGDPKQELVDKLTWTYDPLPYILGYYAQTTNVYHVAITPTFEIRSLFYHNLRFKVQRVAHMVHLIRLSGIIAGLGQQLHSRNTPEFMTFERQGGSVKMTITTIVRKEFMDLDAVERVLKLVEIYKLLKHKNVPNVDTLESYNTNSGHPHVHLSPVGIDRHPESGLEAFNAVFSVLTALKVMHSSPDPVYHRDIRGPNIIKKFDGQGWFLIDWCDASMAPTRAVMHLKESEHSVRVRQDGHGAEVDIWGVGKYLETLASLITRRIAKPDAVKQMARRWMTDITTSAESALNEVIAARDLFIAPPNLESQTQIS